MGYFELIVGCPFSGKTSNLIKRINKYRLASSKIVLVSPYSQNGTHDKMTSNIKSIKTNDMKDLIENDLYHNIILIDDIHLFINIEHINTLLDVQNKTVIATILNKREYPEIEVNNLSYLVPLTEKVTFIKALVKYNNEVKETSHYIIEDGNIKLIPNNRGKLQLIMGPMFSGKTSELIRMANCYKNIGLKVITINHKINQRYDTKKICSHDKVKLETHMCLEKLNQLMEDYRDIYDKNEVFVIEEMQFFEDGYDIVKKMLNDNKIVIACGLDGNFRRENFGDMGRLISLADDVQKLNAVCLLSSPVQNAPFTRRIIRNERETLVGTDDCYISCSRDIFNLDNREFIERYNKYKNSLKE